VTGPVLRLHNRNWFIAVIFYSKSELLSLRNYCSGL
jgi:hypothetical protein